MLPASPNPRPFCPPLTPAAPRPRAAVPRAVTLVELLVALVVVAILSTAITTLVFGAMNDNRYLQNNAVAQSELELAMRRITNNIREGQTGTVAVGPSALSMVTQPDSADGYPSGVTVSYAVQNSTTVTGQKDLTETDQRYGTNVLVHNVTTFSAAQVSGISNLFQIDIVVGTAPQTERHFKVFARN